MRIIKEGKNPPKEIEKTCERCGCVFAYKKDDIKGDWTDDMRTFEYYVECPHCKCSIEVGPFPSW